MKLRIGSADVHALLASPKTKMHQKLIQDFVSDTQPYYNAYNSPIDALRIGAIVEDVYGQIEVPEMYPQVKVTCKEMDVFRCSLDFAELEGGEVVFFQEVKTSHFNDFINIEPTIEYFKKKYKNYYNQVQHQLLCTNIDWCEVVFICVYNYNDEDNYNREFSDNDIIKIVVNRDEKLIEEIKEKGQLFQSIRNHYAI